MSKAKSPSPNSPAIARDNVQQLLEFISSPEVLSEGIGERRQKLLDKVAEIIDADLGVWSWGPWGNDISVEDGILPVAMIVSGMTNAQKAYLTKFGLQRDNDVEFRQRTLDRMGSKRQITLCRTELYSEKEWSKDFAFRRMCHGLGMNSWITSIRFPNAHSWCNFSYWRKIDRDEFSRQECELVDLVLGSISWVLPTASEFLPPEVFQGLTVRQRSVLLLLLDGMPRKAVAKHLGLTEHTVGDHIKAIYRVFNVHSLGEIVAVLLKSR